MYVCYSMSLYLTILMCVGLWCVMWCEGSQGPGQGPALWLGCPGQAARLGWAELARLRSDGLSPWPVQVSWPS